MDKIKTTKADFEFFKAEALKWIDKFHLGDNEIVFSHREMRYMGQMSHNYTARRVEISLALVLEGNFGTGYKKEKLIQEVALHEVLELLLGRLTRLAEARFIDPDEIEAETHAIIHRIEKVVNNGK